MLMCPRCGAPEFECACNVDQKIMSSFDDFVQWVNSQSWSAYWREGQKWFNACYFHRPEIADNIRGGPIDPFYDDRRIPMFLEEVKKNW